MSDQLNFHKKRRRITRSSLTKLATKLTGLESTTENPDTLRNVMGLTTKLKALDAEFRTHHLSIIDLTEDEEALTEEQRALDDHDDQVSELNIRIQRLTSSLTPSSASNLRKSSSRRLTRLREKLAAIRSSIDVVTNDGVCTLQQHEEQIADLKKELKEIQTPLLEVDLEASDPLIEAQDAVEWDIFECSLAIKKRLRSTVVIKTSATPEATGAKLPKLEVPTFNGDILCWKGFWEQFCVSVHDRTNLTNAEKLVYLQNAIKDNTAKHTIEGLTKSGEHYEEAVKCLQSRYDRPLLIHQTHVRRILDAPSLRGGSGKELRTLHDVVLQHLRALKAMGHEPSNSFITSLLELKLDPNTMFEWQRHTQEHADVPDFQELLDFLNLRAQAAEASVSGRKPMKGGFHGHSSTRVNNPVPSFASNANPISVNCIACRGEKHAYYSCSKFRSLPRHDMVALLRSNNHCLNCLRPGHFVKECKSLHHCKRCQRPHHTLLHIESKVDDLAVQQDRTFQ